MLTLYYVPKTRAGRARWMLEELGVSHELVRVDVGSGENRSPAYLGRKHPLGHVPVLVDGETAIFESGAIIAYLADRFPEKGLAPPPASRERGLYYQWMFFAVTEIEPHCATYNLHTRRLGEGERVPGEAERAHRAVRESVAALEQLFADGREYLLGHFTAADVICAGVVAWAASLKLVDAAPRTLAWSKRCADREAARRSRAD